MKMGNTVHSIEFWAFGLGGQMSTYTLPFSYSRYPDSRASSFYSVKESLLTKAVKITRSCPRGTWEMALIELQWPPTPFHNSCSKSDFK